MSWSHEILGRNKFSSRYHGHWTEGDPPFCGKYPLQLNEISVNKLIYVISSCLFFDICTTLANFNLASLPITAWSHASAAFQSPVHLLASDEWDQSQAGQDEIHGHSSPWSCRPYQSGMYTNMWLVYNCPVEVCARLLAQDLIVQLYFWISVFWWNQKMFAMCSVFPWRCFMPL